MRTEKHNFEGSLTVASESLIDNCTKNENLAELGSKTEQDNHIICDKDSTSSPNMSCRNVENTNLIANSDDHENNNDNLCESRSKSPVFLIGIHCMQGWTTIEFEGMELQEKEVQKY